MKAGLKRFLPGHLRMSWLSAPLFALTMPLQSAPQWSHQPGDQMSYYQARDQGGAVNPRANHGVWRPASTPSPGVRAPWPYAGFWPGRPRGPATPPLQSKRLKPPVDRGKLIAELLAGGTVGIGLGYLGASLGARAVNCAHQGALEDFACDLNVKATVGIALGGLIAYPIGTALGVYGAGSIGNQTGSFGAALVGSYLGLLAGGVVGSFIRGTTNSSTAGIIVFLAAAPIAATVKFNGTLRFKHSGKGPAIGSGLINFRHGRLACALPKIGIAPGFSRGNAAHLRLQFVEARF